MYHLQQLETSLKYLHPKAYFCNLKNKISVVYASFHTDLVLRILEVGSLYHTGTALTVQQFLPHVSVDNDFKSATLLKIDIQRMSGGL